MPSGKIKNLVRDRGFGFISPDETPNSDDDLFFHRTDLQAIEFDGLQIGQQVEYDLGRDARRGTTKATNVRAMPA